MSIEDKFKAAVNVIRSLPKSGSYQPSNEMLLRFYSYYKQATDGPCDKSKPGFWDVVNRAKWEAWNKLGNMTQEEAMEAYVHELHRIVETMSYTDNVASFMAAGNGTHNEMPGFPADDLELVAGDIMEKVRSRHNTPLGSREVSRTPSPNRTPSPIMINHRSQRETTPAAHESEDEFIDTVEQNDEAEERQQNANPAPEVRRDTNHTILNGFTHKHESNHVSGKHYDKTSELIREDYPVPEPSLSLLPAATGSNENLHQVSAAVVLDELRGALLRLERDVSALRQAVERDNLLSSNQIRPSWWPFKEISPAVFAFIVVWPFFAQRITRSLTRDK